MMGKAVPQPSLMLGLPLARVSLTKKEQNEKWLVDEFLRYKRIQFRKLQSLQEFRPGFAASGIAGPDTRAECLIRRKWLTVGIEVTEYQSDQTATGSPARRRQDVWTSVWRIMKRDYIPRFPELQGIWVGVNVDDEPPEQRYAELLARELKCFLVSKAPEVTNTQMFHKWDTVGRESCFARFPNLKCFVTSVYVHRMPAGCEGYVLWNFGKAEFVGVDQRDLGERISRKADQKLNYDTEMDQCWLLICASGATAADGAGPAHLSADKLSCPDLSRKAQESGYQKVIFWERVHKWDREL